MVTTTIGTSDVIRKTALQADGKIVAGGYTYDGTNSNFGLARYTVTGALDTTFSTDGIVTTTIGANASLRDLALQTDGKIVAGGGSVNNFALVRYTITGTLDTSFGISGVVTITIGANAEIAGIALQTDGKIVTCGQSDGKIALARYTITGTLDDTFGISGVVTATIGTPDYANDLAIQSDGKIVIGSISQIGGVWCFALSRYTSTGVLDTTTFGDGDGVVTATLSTSDYLYTVALQSDGKILIGGYGSPGGSDYYSVLIRYTSAGALDTSFGGGDGVVTTTAPTYTDIEVYDIAFQSNGKIVAAFYGGGSTTDFMLVRYNTNGTLDTTFGDGDGMVMQHLGAYGESMTLAIQSNGYIVLGGYANYSSTNRFALMRFK